MEDNMNLDTNTRIMDKRPEDLTVGEALKLNLGVMAAFAAVPLVFAGGAVAYEKASSRFRSWKLEKARQAMEEDIQAHNEQES